MSRGRHRVSKEVGGGGGEKFPSPPAFLNAQLSAYTPPAAGQHAVGERHARSAGRPCARPRAPHSRSRAAGSRADIQHRALARRAGRGGGAVDAGPAA